MIDSNALPPKKSEGTLYASRDLVTAYASEVMYHGDAYARSHSESILALIESNRQAAANASAEDIAQTLTRQATFVERIASHMATRAASESDPNAAATLAKTALSAVRTLVQLESALYQMLRDRHGQNT